VLNFLIVHSSITFVSKSITNFCVKKLCGCVCDVFGFINNHLLEFCCMFCYKTYYMKLGMCGIAILFRFVFGADFEKRTRIQF